MEQSGAGICGFTASEEEKPAVLIADTGAAQSRQELDDRVARLISTLRSAGVTRGATVAMAIRPSLEAFEVFTAARRAGLALLIVDSSRDVAELAFIINDSGAKAVFVDAGVPGLA